MRKSTWLSIVFIIIGITATYFNENYHIIKNHVFCVILFLLYIVVCKIIIDRID